MLDKVCEKYKKKFVPIGKRSKILEGFKRASSLISYNNDESNTLHEYDYQVIYHNNWLSNHGIIIDYENDVYVREGYGAFRCNIDSRINSIEELKNYISPILETNPYKEIVDQIEKGYDYVIGPALPIEGVSNSNAKGIYLTNYKHKVIDREKSYEPPKQTEDLNYNPLYTYEKNKFGKKVDDEPKLGRGR